VIALTDDHRGGVAWQRGACYFPDLMDQFLIAFESQLVLPGVFFGQQKHGQDLWRWRPFGTAACELVGAYHRLGALHPARRDAVYNLLPRAAWGLVSCPHRIGHRAHVRGIAVPGKLAKVSFSAATVGAHGVGA